MSHSSLVVERLRAVLTESRLSGLPVPDRPTWLRRFPAHQDALAEVFDEILGPIDVPATAKTATVQLPPEPSLPVWAESPPRIETLREDKHGRLCQAPDGHRYYVLDASRLTGRNPASHYLDRARRIAAADVPGVVTPTIEENAKGDVAVRFSVADEAPVSFAVGPGQRRGATRRALDVISRTAARIRLLHERGAAHGRLRRTSLRIDVETRRLVIDTGLMDGPGLDGGDLGAQQRSDVRALGVMLYGALSLEGAEPDEREIVQRHDGGELPPLGVRRPDLMPPLVRIVDRCLAAGTPAGFATSSQLLDALDRLQDLESEATVRVAPGAQAGRAALILVALIALLAGAWAIERLSSGPDEGARLAVKERIDPRLERVRDLVAKGRHEQAQRLLKEIGKELGINPERVPPRPAPR
ncbi:MAG: hypothetical protein CMJ83_20120 [Planctomycetes bacterium]|nr:hypothetical protein [Planctomycetota bacterium]